MKGILRAVRALLVLTLLTGFVYPLAVTGVAQLLCSHQAGGSLIWRNGEAIGSELIAQKFEGARYFWPRPSAADFATVPSGASNKGPISPELQKAVQERRERLGRGAPPDLLSASGSGLDPHVSPLGAAWQIERVARARSLSVETVSALVTKFTEPPQFGFLGEARVNVFALNRALDELR